MAMWLYKEEPTEYNFADLVRDGETVWSGVSNPLALKHLRAAKPGDSVFYYHTGDEKAVVGIMSVAGEPRPDPHDANGKLVVVPVKPVRWLEKPVTLATIKADPLFADWELVRIARLSVMPVSEERWKRILELSAGETMPETPTPKRGKRK